jgi:hypothetical protein
MDFSKCREILVKETELVRRIGALQNLIYEAVTSREWTDFEEHFADLGIMRGEFTVLESEREQIFAEFCSKPDSNAGFYAFASQFPLEQRDDLTAVYRDLKLEAMRVRMAGEALTGYIAGMRATMAGFFEIAFPERGGKIYSPHGNAVSHDMRSMVLNQRF